MALSALLAKKRTIRQTCISIVSVIDDVITSGTMCRLEFWRIGKLLKIVFISTMPHVIFRIKTTATFFACLPIAYMSLNVMKSTSSHIHLSQHSVLVSLFQAPPHTPHTDFSTLPFFVFIYLFLLLPYH